LESVLILMGSFIILFTYLIGEYLITLVLGLVVWVHLLHEFVVRRLLPFFYLLEGDNLFFFHRLPWR